MCAEYSCEAGSGRVPLGNVARVCSSAAERRVEISDGVRGSVDSIAGGSASPPSSDMAPTPSAASVTAAVLSLSGGGARGSRGDGRGNAGMEGFDPISHRLESAT